MNTRARDNRLDQSFLHNAFRKHAMTAATPTILVVEDDNIVRMLIVDVLEELDYTVLAAADGEQALGYLMNTQQVIDLLMTDNGLPDTNGVELANKARTLRPDLPVLFASGYAENIEVPPDMDMISKPFSIDQLRDKVKQVLGQTC
jgi:CheY-like chemotaxis protein